MSATYTKIPASNSRIKAPSPPSTALTFLAAAAPPLVDMLAMEHGRQLRPEEHDRTGHIAPGQQGDGRADRAVEQVVVKIRDHPGEGVFGRLPQDACEDRPGD